MARHRPNNGLNMFNKMTLYIITTLYTYNVYILNMFATIVQILALKKT